MNDVQVFTGEGIDYVQMAAVKMRLKLEIKGLTFRGPSIRKGWAQRLGLRSAARREEIVAELERRMQDILARAAA